MGGFHVYFFPDEAAEHADALIIGEAEEVPHCAIAFDRQIS
jgi:hypothetical protein